MSDNKLITFPAGIARFPALHQPDTKFDDLGQYRADFVVPKDVAEPFIKKLQKEAKEHMGKALPKAKNSLWEFLTDEDGEETGEVMFKVRVKNKLSKKTGKLWDRRPAVIDARKQNLPADIAVGGGSKIRVQAEVYPWVAANKKGISMQPVLIQVIDLKTWQRGDVDAFDEVDDGFGEDQIDSSGDDQAGDDDDY